MINTPHKSSKCLNNLPSEVLEQVFRNISHADSYNVVKNTNAKLRTVSKGYVELKSKFICVDLFRDRDHIRWKNSSTIVSIYSSPYSFLPSFSLNPIAEVPIEEMLVLDYMPHIPITEVFDNVKNGERKTLLAMTENHFIIYKEDDNIWDVYNHSLYSCEQSRVMSSCFLDNERMIHIRQRFLTRSYDETDERPFDDDDEGLVASAHILNFKKLIQVQNVHDDPSAVIDLKPSIDDDFFLTDTFDVKNLGNDNVIVSTYEEDEHQIQLFEGKIHQGNCNVSWQCLPIRNLKPEKISGDFTWELNFPKTVFKLKDQLVYVCGEYRNTMSTEIFNIVDKVWHDGPLFPKPQNHGEFSGQRFVITTTAEDFVLLFFAQCFSSPQLISYNKEQGFRRILCNKMPLQITADFVIKIL